MDISAFILEHSKVILESCSALFINLAHNSRMVRRVVKRMKLWVLLVYLGCILMVLTLNISRPFGVIWCTFPKKGHDSKMFHRRVKRMKIFTTGEYIVCVHYI